MTLNDLEWPFTWILVPMPVHSDITMSVSILNEDSFECKIYRFQPIVLLHSMIGYWHKPVVRPSVRPSVCLSVRLSVTLCIVALRVGVRG